jgi:peptidoglycan/xylan/chitin deacetylase (PgdA/CDA1 family)
MLIAVNFHYIRPSFDEPYEAIHGVTPSQFERQLEVLGAMGEFVGADQIRDAVNGAGHLPERSIAVTVDDGLREQFDHAWPVLARMGIPAIFYINTAPVVHGRVSTVHKIHLLRSQIEPGLFLQLLRRHAEAAGIYLGHDVDERRALLQYEYDLPAVATLKYLLNLTLTPADKNRLIDRCFDEYFSGDEPAISRALYMDTAQIRTLGQNRLLGVHSHEHLPLGLLPRQQAEEQIRNCVAHLSRWGGYTPYTLSYPFGERDACSIEAGSIASEFGMDFAFTMERALNQDLAHPLHLARFDSNDAPGGKRPYWNANIFFERAPGATWGRTRFPIASETAPPSCIR